MIWNASTDERLDGGVDDFEDFHIFYQERNWGTLGAEDTFNAEAAIIVEDAALLSLKVLQKVNRS
jgi:hypothetical protein